jgi:20S proteasome alpha/beta subunit
MTIAVGFKCDDGVLIAADTEQGVLDSYKSESGKIQRGSTDGFGDYVAASSGNITYCGMAFEMLEEYLTTNREFLKGTTPQALFKRVFRRTVRDVHRHITACTHEYRPELEMILGFHSVPPESQQQRPQPTLFHVGLDGGIKEVGTEIFIGSGAPIAYAFHRILSHHPVTIEIAKWLAFFILYQAKKSGYGVGGSTNTARLPAPQSKQMAIYDDERIAEDVETLMRICLIDARDRSLSPEAWKERLQKAFNTLQDIRFAMDRVEATNRFVMETL